MQNVTKGPVATALATFCSTTMQNATADSGSPMVCHVLHQPTVISGCGADARLGGSEAGKVPVLQAWSVTRRPTT